MRPFASIRGPSRRTVGLFAVGTVLLAGAMLNLPEKPLPPVSASPPLEEMSVGVDRHRGNLLGLQPYMRNADYASKERFLAKSDAYLEYARGKGYLTSRTVVVYPEFYGTWLVAAEERNIAYTAPDVDRAMRSIALRHPFRFLAGFLASHKTGKGRIQEAFFRMKAKTVARIYEETFRDLARKYRVTIIPGTFVLPDPRVEGGRLRFSDGPLVHASVLFRPDGTLDPQITRKAYLTADEEPFLTPGRADDLPVYDTPAGRVAVLICADSWYPEPYRVAARKGARRLVVPSYSEAGMMNIPWGGYTPSHPTPRDVSKADINRITGRQAWLKYALPGRLAKSGIRDGILPRNQGDFWGLGADGGGIVIRDGRVHQARTVKGATLLNAWL